MTERRRVAVTGLGMIGSLGANEAEIVAGLRAGLSATTRMESWAELRLPSLVAGALPDLSEKIAASGVSKAHRAMAAESGLLCLLASLDAVRDAGLAADELRRPEVSCIVGSGVGATLPIARGAEKVYAGRVRALSPYTICQSMASGPSALLATVLGVEGRSYSISGACATSAHDVGHGLELIRQGAADIVIAGGGEELNELTAAAFGAMRLALSTVFNDDPARASRPYDRDRDGFVLSGGGGIVVLEEWERAVARGARIRAELLGYGACSEGGSMVQPRADGEPAARCMELALADAGLAPAAIDYVNAHGTGTLQGDLAEVQALRRVFGERLPLLSSTKSMTGHAVGAAGALELGYCVAMLEGQFVAPSINIEHMDEPFLEVPIVTEARPAPLTTVMSNSFGFGGTNAVLVLGRAPTGPRDAC